MTLMIVIFFIGIIIGHFVKEVDPNFVLVVCNYLVVLALLIASFNVGRDLKSYKEVKKLKFKVLLIPIVVILCSYLGALSCSILFDQNINSFLIANFTFNDLSYHDVLYSTIQDKELIYFALSVNIIKLVFVLLLAIFFHKKINGKILIALSGLNACTLMVSTIDYLYYSKITVLSFISGITLYIFSPLIIDLIINGI